MKRGIFLAAVAAFAGSTVAHANTIELIQNGGFESNLNGWNASANVIQTGNYFGIVPSTGSGMAAMSVVGFLDSSLTQSVDLSGVNSATLSFSLNLTALDVTRFLELGVDSLTVSIGGTTVYTESLNDPWNGTVVLPGTPTTTGWVLHSGISVPLNLLGQGNINFAFNVENVPPGGGDVGQNFVALIDDVSLKATKVPDSGTGLAFLGLSVWALARMRRALS